MTKPLPHQQAALEDDLKYTRPFFWFLFVVLAFLYAVALYTSPELREPQRAIPFTLMMLSHAVLHALVPRFVTRRSSLIFYLVVQIALVFALSWISRSPAIIVGLYLALAGETAGILEDWKRALIAIILYVALIAITFALVLGWTTVPDWFGLAALMALFVLLYVTMFVRQMNARAEAQQLLGELEVAHRHLGEYAQQVERLTLETERQRMARELHDTLAQGLAGVILQLEALEAFLEKGDDVKAAEIAAQAKSRARVTLSDARRAIDDLRNAHTLTPLQAIGREVERFTRSTGIPCEVVLPDALPLSPEQADHAVRYVSEGLANVAAHAQASRVWLSVALTDGRVVLTLRDDGSGFAPEAVPDGHYGLIGLRERARLAGGTLTVASRSGAGATLTLQLPVAQAAAETAAGGRT